MTIIYGLFLRSDQLEYFSADSSFCWAYSIASMLRHTLNQFLRKMKNYKAEKYLNDPEFHKKLRNGFEAANCRKSC